VAGKANTGNQLSFGNTQGIIGARGLHHIILNCPGERKAILNGIGNPDQHDCSPPPHPLHI
jgi:hypothetical protein